MKKSILLLFTSIIIIAFILQIGIASADVYIPEDTGLVAKQNFISDSKVNLQNDNINSPKSSGNPKDTYIVEGGSGSGYFPTPTPFVPTITPFVPTVTPFIPTVTPHIPTITPNVPTITPNSPTITPHERKITHTPTKRPTNHVFTHKRRAGKDPIVIYFDGESYNKKLVDINYKFDFDFDGEQETIPFPAPGSGFLAIDIDKDNKITNGLELFGPKTDNGFDELKAFDENNDEIIDENDRIYKFLKIWSIDENNIESLVSIKDTRIQSIILSDIKYFNKNEHKIICPQTGKYLGEVSSYAYISWNDDTNGIAEDLRLNVKDKDNTNKNNFNILILLSKFSNFIKNIVN